MNPNKTFICPLSGEKVNQLIYDFQSEYNQRLFAEIKNDYPQWDSNAGICSKLLDYYNVRLLQKEGYLPKAGPEFPIRTIYDVLIPPTPLRLNAHPDFTGKGITICVIDSGFYPHPDIVQLKNRILELIDIATPHRDKRYFEKPHDQSWHGTMTAVACAGNGYLSDGLYKGIACDANLVLLKVQDEKGISSDSITNAIRWAIKNREKYQIRIISLSLSDDEADSYKKSQVDQAAEEAIAAGIVVVAAIGNTPGASIKPPANAPNVLAIGGLNDHNTPNPFDDTLYPSTFGKTVDDFLKPEIIAPAIWIAAPVLPETAEYTEAQVLHRLYYTADESFKDLLRREIHLTKLDKTLLEETSVAHGKAYIKKRIAETKSVSPYYMHVDGTSFAAPIVSSIVAQMLEANPNLTPAIIREILMTTAIKIPNVPVERQGHGVVNARLAVDQAYEEQHDFLKNRGQSPYFDRENQKIVFYYHDHIAKQVMLIGDFTGWSQIGFLFQQESYGRWKIELPMLPAGTYRYKYLIDSEKWISDPRNPFREPDGFNGMNSKFAIEKSVP